VFCFFASAVPPGSYFFLGRHFFTIAAPSIPFCSCRRCSLSLPPFFFFRGSNCGWIKFELRLGTDGYPATSTPVAFSSPDYAFSFGDCGVMHFPPRTRVPLEFLAFLRRTWLFWGRRIPLLLNIVRVPLFFFAIPSGPCAPAPGCFFPAWMCSPLFFFSPMAFEEAFLLMCPWSDPPLSTHTKMRNAHEPSHARFSPCSDFVVQLFFSFSFPTERGLSFDLAHNPLVPIF